MAGVGLRRVGAAMFPLAALTLGWAVGAAQAHRAHEGRAKARALEIEQTIASTGPALHVARQRLDGAIGLASDRRAVDPAFEALAALGDPLPASWLARRTSDLRRSTTHRAFAWHDAVSRLRRQVVEHREETLEDFDELRRAQDVINELAAAWYCVAFTGQGNQFEANLFICDCQAAATPCVRAWRHGRERRRFTGGSLTEQNAGTFYIPLARSGVELLGAHVLGPWREYTARLESLRSAFDEESWRRSVLLADLERYASTP